MYICINKLLIMSIELKLNELDEMFSKCGNGVFIMCMSNRGDEIDRFRICRGVWVGENRRVNWVKCKKILNKKGIEFVEGESGWGMRMSRCIDFNY